MRDQIVRVKRYEKVPLILEEVDLEPEREVMSSEGRALPVRMGLSFHGRHRQKVNQWWMNFLLRSVRQ